MLPSFDLAVCASKVYLQFMNNDQHIVAREIAFLVASIFKVQLNPTTKYMFSITIW